MDVPRCRVVGHDVVCQHVDAERLDLVLSDLDHLGEGHICTQARPRTRNVLLQHLRPAVLFVPVPVAIVVAAEGVHVDLPDLVVGEDAVDADARDGDVLGLGRDVEHGSQVPVPSDAGVERRRDGVAAINGTRFLVLARIALRVAAAVLHRRLEDAPGAVVAFVPERTNVVIVAHLLRVLTLSRVGDALVDGARHAVVAVHGGSVLLAVAGEGIAGVNTIALVLVLAGLGSVDAHGLGVVVQDGLGGVAGVDGALDPVIAVRRRAFHLVALVCVRVALHLSKAKVAVLALRVGRAPVRLLILPAQRHVAQLLPRRFVGGRAARADASLVLEELVRHPSVDEPPPVVLVPAWEVKGVCGRLGRRVDHGVADLVVVAVGEVRHQEGGDSGDVGTGHGGARLGSVAFLVARDGGLDVVSRGRDLRLIVPRAEVAQLLALHDAGHADHALVPAGVVDRVPSRVPRGRHDEHPGVVRVLVRLVVRRDVAVAAPQGHGYDLGPFVDAVLHGGDDGGPGPGAGVGQSLPDMEGEFGRVGHHAHDSRVVASDGPDGAGTVRPVGVSINVPTLSLRGMRVPSSDPIGREVGMSEVVPRVDDADLDVLLGLDGPQMGYVDMIYSVGGVLGEATTVVVIVLVLGGVLDVEAGLLGAHGLDDLPHVLVGGVRSPQALHLGHGQLDVVLDVRHPLQAAELRQLRVRRLAVRGL
mmetsp:Transcript_30518/g.64849  ORF Transcript_30518/g.64849 Transcript_30518/m.64849 type:complete len:700 (-) Transcript_30518:665-2764(-)